MSAPPEDMVPLSLLSAALDEIYLLRSGMAVEYGNIEEVLAYKSLPIGARHLLQRSSLRLQKCASGDAHWTYKDWGISGLKRALDFARAPQTLTRSAFEAEVAARLS